MRMPAIAFFVILGQLRPRWEAEGGGEQPPPIYPLAEAANSAGEMKFFLNKLIHNSGLCILRHACLPAWTSPLVVLSHIHKGRMWVFILKNIF